MAVNRHGLRDTIDDFTVLLNEWPYGIDKDIVHLCVWTKFKFDEDPDTGDLTATARKQIDDFVTKIFRSRMNPEDVSNLF